MNHVTILKYINAVTGMETALCRFTTMHPSRVDSEGRPTSYSFDYVLGDDLNAARAEFCQEGDTPAFSRLLRLYGRLLAKYVPGEYSSEVIVHKDRRIIKAYSTMRKALTLTIKPFDAAAIWRIDTWPSA